MTEGGHIVTPGGRALSWSPDDALWLRRAVEREGEPRDWVAQALVNRWAVLRDRGRTEYPTLASFVRAYAQPVNPRWFPAGDLHLEQLDAHASRGAAHRADMIARAERRENEYSRATIFSPQTVAAADRALTGPLTLPPGVTDYAADTASARTRHGTPTQAKQGENAFWSPHPGKLYSIPADLPAHPAGRMLRTAGVHAGFGMIALLSIAAIPFVVSVRESRKLGRRRQKP